MANTSPAPPFKVKALFDYSSPHDDDLNFPADEVITVTEEEDDDWYYGEYTDKATGALKQGIFPKNFVERIVVELPPRPTRPGGGARGPKKPADENTQQQQEEYGGKSPPYQAPPPQDSSPPAPTVNTAAAGSRPSTSSTIASPVAREAPKQMEVRSPPRVVEEPRPVQVQQQEHSTPASPPSAPRQTFNPRPQVPTSTEEKKTGGNKPPPPEKPSSFKDRLALFNKVSTTPITPYNPHRPPVNFIKKPFVAPPPSKNSYVPPPTQHTQRPKRDEDSNYIRAEATEDTSRMSLDQERDKEEERPKLALKDRIALLQTQQLDPSGIPGGKPKRPPKPKRTESDQTAGEGNTEETGHSLAVQEESVQERRSFDSGRDHDMEEHEPAQRQKKSLDIGHDDNTRAESSAGDADASSIAEDQPPAVHRPRPNVPTREDKSDDGDDEGANDDTPDVASDDEEEEVDPEVARKLAIRERIAKMSGGMGMHGMFGPPMGIPMGGPPPAPPKKKKTPPKPSREEEDSRETHEAAEPTEDRPMSSTSQSHQQQPVALPFAMPRVQSPPAVEMQQYDSEDEEPAKDTVGTGKKISEERASDEEADIEDLKPQPPQSPPHHPLGPRPMPASPKAERTLPERVVPMSPPMLPQERPVPPPPPPIPSERPAPPLPPTGQLLPPAAIDESPTEGSESDDELSAPPSKLSLATSDVEVQPRGAPPPPPPGPPSVPSGRPQSGYGDAKSPTSPASKRASQGYFSPIQTASPTLAPGSPPSAFNKRASYQRGAGGMPPVPGGFPVTPGSGTPHQSPQGVSRAPPPPPPPSGPPPRQSIDDTRPGMSETSDYDTDIGNKVAHRDALKKDHVKEEDEETPLPSPVISPQAPPRSVPPPPPPANPPPSRKGRASVDMPRGAPPPPPPAQTQEQEQYEDDDAASAGTFAISWGHRPSINGSVAPPQGSGRRSMDQSRPSAEYVARDIELGESTKWWTSPNTPPPIFQNRPRELYFEVEEVPTTRRGGRTTITKDVYVLFHDYSQTVVTARYDRDEPQTASLEQRHEAPPPQPRQDQLEDFQAKFGAKIAAGAKARENTVVAGGDPEALIRELLELAPGYLPPAGARSYGALVYANLANASVQQFDEIRAGDIVTFRNAKFQGHKGGLHQKYSMEAGKPDHVAVVVDWDGTKKKLRAWEQGRESRKVKMESFKVSDLRSGEVKVWRVVGREWVGWGAQQ
ncbi:uncharacterized protein LAJ45_09350 [Morchella importuna]|uniref:uncharacterized protein n=1 Tax=Morchella importuna TaxID=1174673 RepID=UPI001E8D3736|nr:uncharacterized protein LAJ45_09350 [Morchella importuna]KAH8146667.1 hypothetical protein LAJ45_09350 [Morchella importuna]